MLKYDITVDNTPVVNGGYGPGWEASGSRGCVTDNRKGMNWRIFSGLRFALSRIERYGMTRSCGYTPKMQEDAIYEMIAEESGTGGDEVYR